MSGAAQPGIFEPVPAVGSYLFFRLAHPANPRGVLRALAARRFGTNAVVGLGPSVVAALDARVDGLRELPALSGPGVSCPSTPGGLWIWLRGDDAGELVHQGRAVEAELTGAFELDEVVPAFRHGVGLDLSGYVDGTENPTGDAALAAARVAGRGAGLDGSSFVAVQRWVHDLDRLDGFDRATRDLMIGRRLSDDEEIDDAPQSAHVKRTEQEGVDPPAFMVRRSMPWAERGEAGLMFVAFGHSFDGFERLLKRMLGLEDGITDALFRFTRPVSGSAYWCPPTVDGRLDLSALGLS